ncbi:MAG: LysR substrate-binding domain-containing protein [Cyanobacteria bacterium P01_D01_bin.105]
MSDRISTLRLFCRVAILGSFTAAGQEIDLSQPSVSRIISKLEKDLGAALFVRSTHAVKLTEAGSDYLARIEPLLGALEEANHLVRSDGKLQGRLRVGSAISFAVREIIPRLPDFLEQHPNLNVDLVLTDSFQDLIDQGIDVALRFGPLRDSTMVARRLGVTPRLIAASPAYLAKAGTPKTPADLAGHQVIIGPSSMGSTGWTFKKDGKTLSVRVEGQLMVTVNDAATVAAVAGMGIISTSFWGCRAELESGELIQLLTDWEIGTVEVNALLAGGKSAKPSARTFADYLVASFRDSA